jgi:tRNA pseudouridine32 synthase/23S rRNA pseudouridine746 synthase
LSGKQSADVCSIPLSRLYLPKLESPPITILEYLIAHFPNVLPRIWRERVACGLVTVDNGTTLRQDSPYRHGITILYRKAVPSEPEALEAELVVYRDDEIIVVDKPHGMLVTPAGEHVERSLLVRLQRSTGLATLAPMHRLDRETAGILLFAINPSSRSRYHQLFAKGLIEREYLAVADVVDSPDRKQWRVENRLEAGNLWYSQRIVEGVVNAITEIQLINLRGRVGLFRLTPKTGKKHQLRVHMASLGFPIVGDPLYSKIRENPHGDPPMQLLASRLAFIDPLSGLPRSFTSVRNLSWP